MEARSEVAGLAAARWLWLPSGLLGMALAIVVGTAAGILLYNAEGLALAGFTMGAVAAFSLGAGAWTATREQSEVISSALVWWVGFLVTVAMGALFVGMWELLAGVREARFSQPLGLGLVCALPAYFAGGVFGRIAQFAHHLSAWGLRRRVLWGGVVGGAFGAAMVWFALGRLVLAVTAVLGAAILASLGARLLGWVVDRLPRRQVLLEDSDRGELRFEVWSRSIPKVTTQILWDGGMRRMVVPPQEGTWVDAVMHYEEAQGSEARTPEDMESAGIFFLGVGGWWHPSSPLRWVLHEPDDVVLRLTKEGLGWDETSITSSFEPPPGLSAAVLDRESLSTLFESGLGLPDYVRVLAGAGIRRVWIGGDRRASHRYAHGAVDPLEMNVAVREYEALVGPGRAPASGPPRTQTLRLLSLGLTDTDDTLPESIGPFRSRVEPSVEVGEP